MALIPFDDRDGQIWLDGKLVPWREAKVHVLTHGLHYGSAVFEGQRAYDGEIFKLEEHTDRLIRSAAVLGMRVPFAVADINRACRDVLAAAELKDAYMRPVAWRGSEQMSVSAQGARTHVAIACWAWPSMYDPAIKAKGIKLDIARWRRPAPDCAPVKAKAAGLYMICTLAKHEAEDKGCADAMMYDYRGLIAEATGANIFFAREGKLHTPMPDCFLDGITRRTVMELARARQIEVIERHIPADELSSFSESFLTGTAAEVTAVSEIGPHKFAPGQITRGLAGDYEALVRRKKAA